MWVAWIAAAFAVEGMWEPHQIPELAQPLSGAGFQGDAGALSRLDSAPLGAVVSLGGFCTASFVSPDGLLITNHHCVTNWLQQASRDGENLIDTGVYAADRAAERSVGAGGRVYVTTDVRDVTPSIIGKLSRKLSDLQRSDQIEANIKATVAACEKPRDTHCRVASFYGGSTYRLITQREINDVRVVMAPPDSVGNYGDEVDNWHWPRHSGDFAFVRAYVAPNGSSAPFAPENIPYRPAQVLTVSPRGVNPGDFVMVAGYPGTTDRWRTAYEVEREATLGMPTTVRELQAILDVFAEVSKANPAAGPILEPSRLGLSNRLFNTRGTLEGFAKGDVVRQVQAREAALDAWIASDPTRKAKYAKPIADLRNTLASGESLWERDYLLSMLYYSSDLLDAARIVVTRAHERRLPDKKRRLGYQERDESRTRAKFETLQRGLQLDTERVLVRRYLKALTERRDCPDELRAWLGLGPAAHSTEVDAAIDRALERLFTAPLLGTVDGRLRLLDTPLAKLRVEDGFLSLAVALRPFEERKRIDDRTRGGAISRLRPLYVEALRASAPLRAYPDANSTLRVTFGTVQGYSPRDGVQHTPQTRLEGIAEKAGAWPFDAEPALLTAIAGRQHGPYADVKLSSVPVNFLSDLDITGGNSGSPTLDAQGRLVGLAFDGNIEGIASDWFFDAARMRTIHCDIRYLLWYLDAVAGADTLLRELGQQPALDTVKP
jgi:hypothetical protein